LSRLPSRAESLPQARNVAAKARAVAAGPLSTSGAPAPRPFRCGGEEERHARIVRGQRGERLVLAPGVGVPTVSPQEIAEAAASNRIVRRELDDLAEGSSRRRLVEGFLGRVLLPCGDAQVELAHGGAHVSVDIGAPSEALGILAGAREIASVLQGVEQSERQREVVRPLANQRSQLADAVCGALGLGEELLEQARIHALEAQGLVQLLHLLRRLHARDDAAVERVRGGRVIAHEAPEHDAGLHRRHGVEHERQQAAALGPRRSLAVAQRTPVHVDGRRGVAGPAQPLGPQRDALGER
jgi:hypothetical protein